MDTLFSHVNVVTMNEQMTLWQDAFVGVTDGKISYMAKKPPEEDARQTVDGTGMVLMPGLINCHTHLPMYLMRGYADDLSLHDWLKYRIFPREEQMDGRAAKAAATLAIAEALRFGTTSVSDMYQFGDEVCQVIADTGIKANLSRGIVHFGADEEFCFDTDPACQELVRLTEKWHNYDHGRIKIDASIHAEYTSGYRLWDAMAEYALSNGLQMQMHLAETKQEQEDCVERYGLTPAQVLSCHHLFDVPTTAAHCVHISADDMQLLARHHVSAVHCPVSSLKLAAGCADVLSMVRAGMNVCLGTDSVASSNNLDLFEQMKAAALMAKARTGDVKALPVEAVLMMATVCGARAQGRSAECGVIELGMDADLILIDFNQPQLIPCHNVLSNLVYAASGRDVVMTMVRGRILYFAGKYPTIDVAAALRELHDYAIPKTFSDQTEADPA